MMARPVEGSGTLDSGPGFPPVAMLPGMNADGAALAWLSDRECLRLMASVPVGRIIYTLRALPAVEAVNFALDGGDVVIGIDQGSPVLGGVRDAVVAFEADEFDPASHTGWSVTVVGTSREVADPTEADRLREAFRASWAPGGPDHFVRIVPGIIRGRRLVQIGYGPEHKPRPVTEPGNGGR